MKLMTVSVNVGEINPIRPYEARLHGDGGNGQASIFVGSLQLVGTPLELQAFGVAVAQSAAALEALNHRAVS